MDDNIVLEINQLTGKIKITGSDSASVTKDEKNNTLLVHVPDMSTVANLEFKGNWDKDKQYKNKDHSKITVFCNDSIYTLLHADISPRGTKPQDANDIWEKWPIKIPKEQADAIAINTTKVGITKTQSDAIENNSNFISNIKIPPCYVNVPLNSLYTEHSDWDKKTGRITVADASFHDSDEIRGSSVMPPGTKKISMNILWHLTGDRKSGKPNMTINITFCNWENSTLEICHKVHPTDSTDVAMYSTKTITADIDNKFHRFDNHPTPFRFKIDCTDFKQSGDGQLELCDITFEYEF